MYFPIVTRFAVSSSSSILFVLFEKQGRKATVVINRLEIISYIISLVFFDDYRIFKRRRKGISKNVYGISIVLQVKFSE